jgi:hypothetical protein
MRSSSSWTTLESELVCRSVIVGCGPDETAAVMAGLDAGGGRLSTIFKKQLTSIRRDL